MEEIYEMLELSGELVKLRLQSAKCRMNNIPTIDAPATGLEIPDMSSLHRVSAWAEIFDELNQIVVGTPTGKKENGDRAAKYCGISSNMNDNRRKNMANEGEIRATQCCEVKSENDEFWEKLDELWEGMSSTHQKCVVLPVSQNSKTRCEPSSSRGVHDSSSCGTLTGKSISVRYVVQEKCVNPVETHERTTQQAYAYLAEDSHGNLIHNNSKILECVSEDLKPTCNAPSSFASDNETEQFYLQKPIHKLSQSSQELRGNSEQHKNLELFPAVSDGTATASDSAQNDVLQTHTFSLKKCEEQGFGFTLKPDKFQQEVYVASILSGGPCDGMLQPLDKITKVSVKKFVCDREGANTLTL